MSVYKAIMSHLFSAFVAGMNQNADVLDSHLSDYPNHGNLKNKIINGNFDVWQRGTSFSTHGQFTADRWKIYCYNGVFSVTRQPFSIGQTDVPGNPKYFTRIDITSSPTAETIIAQNIEDVRTLAGKKATLSFWVRSNIQTLRWQIYQIFGSGGSDTVLAGSDTYSATTSWQKITATVNVPSIAGKTIGADSCLLVRPVRTGTETGWIELAQVQLEEGEYATPFEQRPIGLELMLCQRYFEKSMPIGSPPVQGVARHILPGAYAFTADRARCQINFKQTKRTTPTMTIFRTADGSTDGKPAYFTTSWQDVTSATCSSHNPGFILDISGTFTFGLTYLVSFGWTADAEL